jgi:hypothetical protein
LLLLLLLEAETAPLFLLPPTGSTLRLRAALALPLPLSSPSSLPPVVEEERRILPLLLAWKEEGEGTVPWIILLPLLLLPEEEVEGERSGG